jgi:hypothetical protein
LSWEELHRGVVERVRIFVKCRMGEVLEDDKLALPDGAGEPISEARGAHQIVRPECDERRRLDTGQDAACVVRDDCLGLCSDSDRTRCGWRAARCVATAAPRETTAQHGLPLDEGPE